MINRKQSGRDTGDGEPKREEPARPKRSYRTPRLAVYGSLRHLALGVGGKRADGGGNPKSKL